MKNDENLQKSTKNNKNQQKMTKKDKHRRLKLTINDEKQQK